MSVLLDECVDWLGREVGVHEAKTARQMGRTTLNNRELQPSRQRSRRIRNRGSKPVLSTDSAEFTLPLRHPAKGEGPGASDETFCSDSCHWGGGLRYEAAQELAVGWIGVVRPSRWPLSRSLTMRNLLDAIRAFLILRSAQRARLEGRKAVLQPFISIFAQPLR